MSAIETDSSMLTRSAGSSAASAAGDRVAAGQRLGQPLADVSLAAHARRAEHVEADPSRRGHQPCAGGIDLLALLGREAVQADVRLLHGVLGIHGGTQQTVGQPEQLTALARRRLGELLAHSCAPFQNSRDARACARRAMPMRPFSSGRSMIGVARVSAARIAFRAGGQRLVDLDVLAARHPDDATRLETVLHDILALRPQLDADAPGHGERDERAGEREHLKGERARPRSRARTAWRWCPRLRPPRARRRTRCPPRRSRCAPDSRGRARCRRARARRRSPSARPAGRPRWRAGTASRPPREPAPRGSACRRTATISQPGGISRSAPSTNARYQSGPAPAVACPGSDGPYSQTGLIVTNAPVRASTPKTMKKTPPERRRARRAPATGNRTPDATRPSAMSPASISGRTTMCSG